ncbi:hypothetical protein ACLBKU_11330 [Erythrobacter sp. NE805]|uniref:hypothetical protein n=1 Tax=Erythrobacter sp. NE805 TaxID=3389875 RepID=UPI00396AF79C
MKAALPPALALAAALTLAGCTSSTPAPTAARPAPAPAARPAPAPGPARPAPPAPLPADPATTWIDAPQTPGAWRYERLERTTTADYRSPERSRLVSIACRDGGQVMLDVDGARAGSLTIRTETATRTLLAEANRQFAFVLLSPTDPLLDAIALSKGRFSIEAEGAAPLYLPSWAEVSRVIEDCR